MKLSFTTPSLVCKAQRAAYFPPNRTLAPRTCRRGREGRHGKPPSWLARAKELLHDRAFESVKLYEIAKAVDIHPAQLSREFGRFFKVTPGEYLRQLRIEFATKQFGRDGHGFG